VGIARSGPPDEWRLGKVGERVRRRGNGSACYLRPPWGLGETPSARVKLADQRLRGSEIDRLKPLGVLLASPTGFEPVLPP
jgi:hypothetical protein